MKSATIARNYAEALQLAAEEQRRRLTAERQNKGLLDSFPDKTDDPGDDATGPEKP